MAEVKILACQRRGDNMDSIRCGMDIAKRVFQVHWVDERGGARIRKTLKRAQALQHFVNVLSRMENGVPGPAASCCDGLVGIHAGQDQAKPS